MQTRATKKEWLLFLDRFFLVSGIALLGLAVMFFVAYNWSKLGKFFKFGLVEVLIVLGVVAHYKSKAYGLFSQLSLLFSSFLVGVLLALFGQIYQLPADSWKLFFYWSILILPWGVVSKNSLVMLLFLLLFDLSVFLLLGKMDFFFSHFYISPQMYIGALSILNAIFYILFEHLKGRLANFYPKWESKVIFILTVVIFVSFIFVQNNEGVAFVIGAVVFGITARHFYLKKDLFYLSILYFAIWVSALKITFSLVMTNSHNYFDIILPLGFVSVGVASYLLSNLKALEKEQKDD